MRVPFVDLKAQYATIKDEIDPAIAGVVQKCAFVLGPAVGEFEENFARFCGVKHCVAVNSGTSALHCALTAAGVGPGDEVITAANTFVATCAAISHCGATPVLVDPEPATYNIDPKLIGDAITPRTKAILPVHLYGRPAPMDAINAVAKTAGLPVIEDACQAHGAKYKGRRAGQLGRAACFSFYPGKNLGAYGEGGAVVTDDDDLAAHVRMLRDHGSRQKYHHEMLGYNYRMEGIQGAVLNVKLKHLDEWNARRRSRADRYREKLAGANLVLPPADDDSESVYHLFVVQVDDRSRFQDDLKAAEIDTIIHYPIPVHRQKAYAHLADMKLPVTDAQAGRIVSLPMFAELTTEQVDFVAETARNSVDL
ncbi:MAG TPA: DegT/DnrJ/EryC1/StrS family aminotransferase [Acidobacteriota bacterium]|nr:DegT/DnrJ/EryC1/StrS family aminotransferase [Acidobacteriota bacterium]